jgi:hypothetical protein
VENSRAKTRQNKPTIKLVSESGDRQVKEQDFTISLELTGDDE